ncbi:peptidyl-prolyl cis-trans isomerase [Fragilaria crotonensis]|nr:peptidyl-prolyl cis-trans isomerase [Fragilaria crotonensis]
MIRIRDDGLGSSSPKTIGPAVLLGQDSLALAMDESIQIYELDTLSQLKTIHLHAAPITAMVYNARHQCVMSTDQKGVIELWCATQNQLGSASVEGIAYASKADTGMYALFRKKTSCLALATSGSHYALYGRNGIIYLMNHASGMIVIRFDERLKVYDETFRSHDMDALEYGKRAAIEREMMQESPIFGLVTKGISDLHQSISITFDTTGDYLIVPTLVGIKVMDWARRKVVKIVGKDDANNNGLRFLSVTLCPGDAKVNQQMQLARTGGSKAAMNFDTMERLNDALLITLAYRQRRFFCFSQVDPIEVAEAKNNANDNDVELRRDIMNEPPTADDRQLASNATGRSGVAALPSEAILRTSMGDIHIKLLPVRCPKLLRISRLMPRMGIMTIASFIV